MSERTTIPWCDSAVNPTMGCDGCELWTPKRKWCYAGVLHDRYGGASKGYAPTFDQVTMFPGRMAKAAKWKDLRGVERADKPWIPKETPRLVFISDMSDALSEAVPFDYLEREIIDIVATWPHTGIWLTKRPARMVEFDQWLEAKGKAWPSNLWALTSITNQATANLRVPQILKMRAAVIGVSYEPALDAVLFAPSWLEKLKWIIPGGISNANKPCDIDWLASALQQCQEANVACFMKQMGSNPYFKFAEDEDAAVILDDKKGEDWAEWRDDLKARQFPTVK